MRSVRTTAFSLMVLLGCGGDLPIETGPDGGGGSDGGPGAGDADPNNTAPVVGAVSPVIAPINLDVVFEVTATDLEDPEPSLTYLVSSTPAHGVAVVVPRTAGAPQQIKYTPTVGYFGPDAFQIAATDSAAESAPQPVSVTVAVDGPALLVGVWRRGCAAGSQASAWGGIQTFGPTTYEAHLTTHTTNCVTPLWRVDGTGTYTIGSKLTLNDATEGRPVDLTIGTQTLTPLSQTGVNNLNALTFCGRNNWSVNTAFSLAACGYAPGATRYNVIRPEFANGVAGFISQDDTTGNGLTPQTRPVGVIGPPFIRD